jgi:hypothetical protein
VLALLGFLLVVVLVVPASAYHGRQRRIDLAKPAFDLADYARRQITILSGEAAFAVTATVLLVTLARDRSSVASEPFNAVIAMFLVAFVSFVGAAIMNALLPGEQEQGPVVARVLFGVTGTQHFRTLFLAWFALRPLVETFQLDAVGALLAPILAMTMLAGWMIVSAMDYRIGLVDLREALVLPTIGLALALLFGIAAFALIPDAHASSTPLVLAFVMFVLNAMTMLVSSALPMMRGRPLGDAIIEPFGRMYAVADFQVSVILLTFTWLAVVGVL